MHRRKQIIGFSILVSVLMFPFIFTLSTFGQPKETTGIPLPKSISEKYLTSGLLTLNLSWVESPSDQLIPFGEPFSYSLTASSPVGIDQWWLNDSANFNINHFGVITNATDLALGDYGVQVWVNDSSSEILSANFTVSVRDFITWTVLVYLDGDNDLEQYAFDDLNAMETIGSSSETKVLVLVDFWESENAPFSEARCYEVTEDQDRDTINSPELITPFSTEPNMGHWETLRDFILFGQAYAPAHNYLLVLWDHGQGCEGLCADFSSDDYMTIQELEMAIGDQSVQHLDIVAFDACLMGQLEVAYQLSNYTDYCVFSEAGVPVTGFPYEVILYDLTFWPDLFTPDEVANNIVQLYYNAYQYGGIYYDPELDDVCLSAVSTTHLDMVMTRLDALASLLTQNVDDPQFYNIICEARSVTQSFDVPEFMDLGDFTWELMEIMDALGYDLIESLCDELYSIIQDVVLAEEHLSGLPGATGLGINFGEYQAANLTLIAHTQWDEFVNAFISVGESSATALSLNNFETNYGYLDRPDDYCYFEFIPAFSGTYTIILDDLFDDYYNDFDLYIYSSSGSEITSSTSSSSYEVLTIDFTEGDTYYIVAHSWDGLEVSGVGVFQLAIHYGTTTLPIPPVIWVIAALAITGIVIIAIVYAIIKPQQRRRETEYYPPPYPSTEESPRPAPPHQDLVRFCAYCGSIVPPKAYYCPKCGASLIR